MYVNSCINKCMNNGMYKMYEIFVLINVWSNCINKMYVKVVLINVWSNYINKMYEEVVLNKCFIKGA